MVKIEKETENDFYIYFSDKTTAKFPYFTLISYMIQSVAPRKVVHLSTEILKINTTGKKKNQSNRINRSFLPRQPAEEKYSRDTDLFLLL